MERAWTSPSTFSGTRTFFSRIRHTARFSTPSAYSFTGGIWSPSWYISVLSQALPPGMRPPMSVWWPMAQLQPTSVS